MAALMGSDVRLAGPKELHPPKDVVDLRREIAGSTGARITITEDPAEAVTAATTSTRTCGSRWASPRTCGPSGSELLTPYQVNTALMGPPESEGKFMHCLPAFHDPNTIVRARRSWSTPGCAGLEVTGRRVRVRAGIVFDQAENRLHTIKAILVATLGS